MPGALTRREQASSEGLCAGLRLRGALSVAYGAGESVSRCPAGKNVALRPTRRQAGFDEFQATETVSWSRGGHSGLCSVIFHGNNVLWKHTMASSCGETRLVVILRTNLPMTPASRALRAALGAQGAPSRAAGTQRRTHRERHRGRAGGQNGGAEHDQGQGVRVAQTRASAARVCGGARAHLVHMLRVAPAVEGRFPPERALAPRHQYET